MTVPTAPNSSSSDADYRSGHKKRQLARRREEKRQAFLELLDRLPSYQELPLAIVNENDSHSSKKTLSDLYVPICRPEQAITDGFWAKVPPVCNPNRAVLEAKLSDERELSMDKYHSEKYRRKLQYKKERGELTEDQVEELWEKHGKRTNKTNDDGDMEEVGDAGDVAGQFSEGDVELDNLDAAFTKKGVEL